MPQTFADVVHEWHGEQPHPQAPNLTVAEFPMAVKLATKIRPGGHASAQEAEGFFHEFKGMNERLVAQGKEPVAPTEFMELVDRMAPLSHTYHGRPPTLPEIVRLRDAHPKDVAAHYAAMPDPHYPHVSAGDMVKALHAANPWSQMLIGRDANKLEAAYLIHSGDHPRSYYEALKTQKDKDGGTDQTGGHPGTPGAADAGGQQPEA